VFKRSDNKARLLSIVIRWVAGGSVSRGNGQSTIDNSQWSIFCLWKSLSSAPFVRGVAKYICS